MKPIYFIVTLPRIRPLHAFLSHNCSAIVALHIGGRTCTFAWHVLAYMSSKDVSNPYTRFLSHCCATLIVTPVTPPGEKLQVSQCQIGVLYYYFPKENRRHVTNVSIKCYAQ